MTFAEWKASRPVRDMFRKLDLTDILAEELKAARRRYQVAGRRLRHQLHRHGQASIALLRRLGTARGVFLAAIAGRKEGDAR